MESFDSIVTQKCSAGVANFWKAVEIWLNSPHLINRRILCSSQLSMYKLTNVDKTEIFKWFTNIKNELVVVENVECKIIDSLKVSNTKNISVDTCHGIEDIDYSQIGENQVYIRFAKLIPRHTIKFSQTLEISLIDIESNSVIYLFDKYCYNEEKKSLGFESLYQIAYTNDHVSINVQNSKQWTDSGSLLWFKNQLFPKLLKWIENEGPKNTLVSGSLKLVSSEKYTHLYNALKVKYGTDMIEIWPESTDPQKFVYEDVAIATYLLLLWESEREIFKVEGKQSFVDLGCGNGLLVHILNSEGHPGLGIDLRRRKIWDLYPETTKLEVL